MKLWDPWERRRIGRKVYQAWNRFTTIRRRGERRQVPRIRFESPVPCTIAEVGTKTAYTGYIHDLSTKGFRFQIDRALPQDHVFRLSFFDYLANKDILSYVLIFPFPSLKQPDRYRDVSVFEYRSKLHPQFLASRALRSYYERAYSMVGHTE